MKGKKRRRRAALILDFMGAVLLIGIILCCIPLTVPRLAGYSAYQVISGSMAPAIPTGSLVYVADRAPEEVGEGDVIAFYSASGSGAVITHRVVQNQVVSGRFVTKGDANDQEDPMPVEYDAYIGYVAYHIPYMGTLLGYVVTLRGRICAVCIVTAAAALHGAAARLRRRK